MYLFLIFIRVFVTKKINRCSKSSIKEKIPMSFMSEEPARSFYFLVRSKAARLIGHLHVEDLFLFARSKICANGTRI
jgi:hypothetical protein